MNRTLKTLTLLLAVLSSVLMTGCTQDDPSHDAMVKFELNLPESVANVADLRIVYDIKGNFESLNTGSTFTKTFTGSMKAKESETFMILSAFLTLKDNYRDIILKMSQDELYTFYNGCNFNSDLSVEIKDEPALHIKQSETYRGVPLNGTVTAEKVIETLEIHAANPPTSRPFFILNVKKDKSKWLQIYMWDVWCEEGYTAEEK